MQRMFSILIIGIFIIMPGINIYGQLSELDSLKSILHASKRSSTKIDAVKEIIRIYVKAKDYDKAEVYAMEYQKLAEEAGTDELIGKAWYNLGIVKWLKGEQEESNLYLEKSIPYLLAIPDSVLLAKCFTKIGTNYLRLSDFFKAIEFYQLSYNIRAELKDSASMANNLINIAGCYYQMASYDSAIRFYHQALNISENINNLKLIAYNFNNIGNIYMKTEDYPNAIVYLQKALEANQQLKNVSEISKNLLNLANAYQESGDSVQAVNYFLESARIKEKLSDTEGLSDTYNSLGSIYKNLGRPEDALAFYNKAYSLIQQGNDKFAEASVLSNIGSVYLSKKQKEAKQYFIKSLDISKEIKARQLELGAYSSLVEYFRLFGDYEQAIIYFEMKEMLNNSIYNENTAHAIADMKTRYETEQKVKENEILARDIRIEKNNKKFLFLISATLLLLLTALAYLFSLKSKTLNQKTLLFDREKELNQVEIARKELEKEHLEDKIFAEKQLNRLQRQKYEVELKHKNHELANSALYIVNKNEVLSSIKEEIISASKENAGESFIPELIRMINNNIDLDQNWQKFRISFEEVHPGFFDKLKQKHPDLSEVYVKMAAYIRINLSTAETAQLLNVSIAAVKKSRQRLRKKLGLPPEASLFDVISSI